jgi:hypothetical protein
MLRDLWLSAHWKALATPLGDLQCCTLGSPSFAVLMMFGLGLGIATAVVISATRAIEAVDYM